jgi:uncharacterized tellurite resistance protein B-like protein
MAMELTYQQKIAMMRILLDIIHADGIIDARETFFFEQLKKELGLTTKDHKVVRAKNSLIALSQVRLLTDEQKKYFATLMSKMIIVDEDINTNETAIYEVVADFCGINVSFEDAVGSNEINNYSKSGQ